MSDFHGQGRRSDEPHCYNCGGAGHWAVACPEPTRQTPAGLEAWRSSASASGYGGRGRDQRNAHKKSKGPIITKYAPPPSATPPPTGYSKAPGYPPPSGPGHYAGPPPGSYQAHQPYPSAQYPAYTAHPPPHDPNFRFHGHPPHAGSVPPLHPPPPPQHYGALQPYGAPAAPPPYSGHGAPPLGPPPSGPPPPGPPPPSSLPPPPHIVAASYATTYSPYTPQRGAGNMHHNTRHRGQVGQGTSPTNRHSHPYRKHPAARPSPARNSASIPSQPINPHTTLPPPPMMHALPPKPPPSAHDRTEQRKDHRSKWKNEKGGRNKGHRDQHHRDANSGRNPASKKKGQQHQSPPEHDEPPGQHSDKLDSNDTQGENTAVESRVTSGVREGEDYSEAAKAETNHDHRVQQATTRNSSPRCTADPRPENGSATNSVESLQDTVARTSQEGKGTLSQDQEQREVTPEPAQLSDQEDIVRLRDGPAFGKAAEEAGAVLPPLPSPRNVVRPHDTTSGIDIAASLGNSNDDERISAEKSHEENKHKRRRSDDSDREHAPEHPQQHVVTEPNIRSLEQLHHRRTSTSIPTDSVHRDNNGFIRSRRRRRSDSDDGSRQHSRRSSMSSRSSGLDSLEAELLGRPSKDRLEDTLEPHERAHDKASKAKRRRPNIDSAYSRRW